MNLLYFLLALLRYITFLIAVVAYFATTVPLYPFYKAYPFAMRKVLVHILAGYAKFCLFFMGIRLNIDLPEGKTLKDYQDRGFLVIGNHMSYMDVIALGSILPSSFVTSVEIRDTPFLGHLCKLAGCSFVERRSRRGLSEEVKEITQSLKAGLNIAIFPEATSTNGEGVIRFKRPLFRAAGDADTQVLPITINYDALNNQPITIENRDTVCWYGDMTFPDHLWGLFKTPVTDMSITFSNILEPKEFEDHGILSEKAHQIVSSKFRPFQKELNYKPA